MYNAANKFRKLLEWPVINCFSYDAKIICVAHTMSKSYTQPQSHQSRCRLDDFSEPCKVGVLVCHVHLKCVCGATFQGKFRDVFIHDIPVLSRFDVNRGLPGENSVLSQNLPTDATAPLLHWPSRFQKNRTCKMLDLDCHVAETDMLVNKNLGQTYRNHDLASRKTTAALSV